MYGFCDIHHAEMDKTGPYGGYHLTTDPTYIKPDSKFKTGICDGKPKAGYTPKMEQTADKIREGFKPKEETNWDEVNLGKCRHGIMLAVIEHGGLEALTGQFERINRLAEFSMTGVMPPAKEEK